MIPADALTLCRLVRAYCPSQRFDEYSAEAWTMALGKYDFADARAAVIELMDTPLAPGKSLYIEPGHIIAGVNRIRRRRLESIPMPPPPADLSSVDQIEWQRKVREQIANGTFVAPEEPKAIMSVPAGSWRDLIRSADPDAPKATKPERRTEISDADAEAERARQLAALEAITEGDPNA